MAYPEPHDLDAIYGPCADEELEPCSECGAAWPASELDDERLCPDCRIEQLEMTRDVK